MEPNYTVTQLLQDIQAGQPKAFDELLAMVYTDLRRMARRHLDKEREDHTLNATALVHEVYLRLVRYEHREWKNRAHFFAVAAQAMRRILSNYARDRNAQKRGGKQVRITLHEEMHAFDLPHTEEIEALDEALRLLEAINERACRIVECRFFAGLTIEETAEALGISSATVARNWRMARAWLKRELAQILHDE